MLNRGKANCNHIWQDLGSEDQERLLLCMATSDMWELFTGKLLRIQEQHISVRKTDMDSRVWEPWIHLVKKRKGNKSKIQEDEIGQSPFKNINEQIKIKMHQFLTICS